jgi:phospho-N-acetylmuramoyl-pentapeptide-transferase
LSTIYGKELFFLQNQASVGETVRELGLAGQNEKAGTPTMEVLITATLVLFYFAKLHNIYIVLNTALHYGWEQLVLSMIISKSLKKDKQGLKGIFKVFGQVGLGVIVGTVFIFIKA